MGGPSLNTTLWPTLLSSHSQHHGSELKVYFLTPPHTSSRSTRAEFRRLTVNTCLEARCEEYRRCEAVMLDLLPQIFAVSLTTLFVADVRLTSLSVADVRKRDAQLPTSCCSRLTTLTNLPT